MVDCSFMRIRYSRAEYVICLHAARKLMATATLYLLEYESFVFNKPREGPQGIWLCMAVACAKPKIPSGPPRYFREARNSFDFALPHRF